MTKKVYIPEGTSVVGPYSPAIETDGFVFLSGQIPIDSQTGKIIDGDIKAQTEKCLKNLDNLLKAADLTTQNVIKTTIYLTNMADYAVVNQVYGEFFTAPYPARTAINVVALPLGAKVEIEVIAKR
ncbi:MAG: Rid family detoxifying hydrolase [Candidatus Gastranaerophilales bacterium]|nr:Rid family detoxifying hydrolase [Candidatus Gastranaerophilales bacterium]